MNNIITHLKTLITNQNVIRDHMIELEQRVEYLEARLELIEAE